MLNIYIIIHSGMLSRDNDKNMRKISCKIAVYEKLNQRKKEKARGQQIYQTAGGGEIPKGSESCTILAGGMCMETVW